MWTRGHAIPGKNVETAESPPSPLQPPTGGLQSGSVSRGAAFLAFYSTSCPENLELIACELSFMVPLSQSDLCISMSTVNQVARSTHRKELEKRQTDTKNRSKCLTWETVGIIKWHDVKHHYWIKQKASFEQTYTVDKKQIKSWQPSRLLSNSTERWQGVTLPLLIEWEWFSICGIKKKNRVKSWELKKEKEMRQSAMKTDLATRQALYRAVPFIVTLWS